jgi:hypothetical protein
LPEAFKNLSGKRDSVRRQAYNQAIALVTGHGVKISGGCIQPVQTPVDPNLGFVLLRFILVLILTACLTGICAADPVDTLLASPCRGLGVEEALRWELSRHNWVSKGWTVFRKGAAYQMSQTVALNKMSDISFTWQVENDAVTATSPASMALCGAQQPLPFSK